MPRGWSGTHRDGAGRPAAGGLRVPDAPLYARIADMILSGTLSSTSTATSTPSDPAGSLHTRRRSHVGRVAGDEVVLNLDVIAPIRDDYLYLAAQQDAQERHRGRLGDPHDRGIRTFVNDDQRQDGNTREMVFNSFEQAVHLSEAFTVEPGDVIAPGHRPEWEPPVSRFRSDCSRSVTSCESRSRHRGLTNTVVEEPEGYSARRSRSPSRGRADSRATELPGLQPRGRIGDDQPARATAAVACVLRVWMAMGS